MKKFFELSVTSRKSVKANTLFSVAAYTDSDEKVGQLDIKLEDSLTFGGLFAKYTPTDIAQNVRISSLKFSGNDEDKIRTVLETLSSEVSKALKNRKMSDASDVLAFLMLSNCVNPETNTIIIPPFGIKKLTSEFISSIAGDDWLGFEVKFSPEIAKKISDAADKKRKETADEIEQLLKEIEQLKSANGELSDEDELASIKSNLDDFLDLL